VLKLLGKVVYELSVLGINVKSSGYI